MIMDGCCFCMPCFQGGREFTFRLKFKERCDFPGKMRTRSKLLINYKSSLGATDKSIFKYWSADEISRVTIRKVDIINDA